MWGLRKRAKEVEERYPQPAPVEGKPFFAPSVEPPTEPLRLGLQRATLVAWREVGRNPLDGDDAEGEGLEWVFSVGQGHLRSWYSPKSLTPDPRNPLLSVLRALGGERLPYPELEALDPNDLIGRSLRCCLIPGDHPDRPPNTPPFPSPVLSQLRDVRERGPLHPVRGVPEPEPIRLRPMAGDDEESKRLSFEREIKEREARWKASRVFHSEGLKAIVEAREAEIEEREREHRAALQALDDAWREQGRQRARGG